MRPASSLSTGRVGVGFWRHIPWVYVAALVVSFILVILISSYYDTYAGSISAIWVSSLYTGFKGSRERERKRIAEGDPHPARRPSVSIAEVILASALVLFTVGLTVVLSYISFGPEHRVPTATVSTLAVVAMLISALTVVGLVIWAKRKIRLTERAEV